MDVKVKDLEKSQIELTIEVEPAELEPYLAQAAAELAKEHKIPGFRPGKAPREVVEKHVGPYKVYETAVNLSLPKFFETALRDKKIEAIGQPKVEVKQLAPGNPFIFKVTVATLPEVTLPDYSKIKKSPKKVEVDTKEVDKVINKIQKDKATKKSVNRPAKKDDIVEVDFESFFGKAPIEGGKSKDHPVTIGAKMFIPGFEEELVGLKPSDEKEFDLKFPENHPRKEFAGKQAHYKVKVKKIFELELPTIDDKFAESLGKFKSLLDLRAQIRKNLQLEKEEKERQRLEMEIIDEIAKDAQTEIPDILIDGELDRMISEMRQSVQAQGMEIDKYLESIGKKEEDLRKEWRPQAEKRTRIGLVLREIANKEKVEATPEDLDAEAQKTLRMYPGVKQVEDTVKTAEYQDYMKGIIRNRKVFKLLLDLATKNSKGAK